MLSYDKLMTTLRQLFNKAQDNGSVDEPLEPLVTGDETDDVLHHQGLEHLQAGEWEAATAYLSELVERHPNHTYYANLLQQAQLKARLDERPPQRRQGRNLLRSRLIWVLATLNLVLWTAVLGRWLYHDQIMPALQQRQRVLQQQQLLEEGRQHLIAGELEDAEERYKEVLALDSGNQTARGALKEIGRRRELAQTYETAMSHIERGAWEAALAALRSIRQAAPGYRDVQHQIERVQEKLNPELERIFQEANQLFQLGQWPRAIEQLQFLRQRAPDYKSEAVKDLIVASYMKQAEVALSGPEQQNPAQEIEQLQKAIGFLTQAVDVAPADQDAAAQLELAQAYLAGLEAYQSESWEDVVVHVTSVYAVAPDYANGRAAARLQTAYVRSGNGYRQKERHEQAAIRYRQAIALGLAGAARQVPAESTELLRTADDLVRQSQYQAATVAYGRILSTMGLEELVGDMPPIQINTSSQPQATPRPEDTPASSQPTPIPDVYVVRPGDTLAEIAGQFNTTVTALMEANPIVQDRDLIRPGWQLVVQMKAE